MKVQALTGCGRGIPALSTWHRPALLRRLRRIRRCAIWQESGRRLAMSGGDFDIFVFGPIGKMGSSPHRLVCMGRMGLEAVSAAGS